jgi:septal ring-binding cell division protein DamX
MQSFDQQKKIKKVHSKVVFIKNSLQWLGFGCCALSLSACVMDGTSTWDGTANDGYFMPAMPDDNSNPPMYMQEYDTSFDSYHSNVEASETGVIVPQSYHLGSNQPPTAKDEDAQWVANKQPDDYTIQIKKDSKASQVANTLQKMPKNERSVEIRSHSGTYLGLHGNYSNREAAEAQLNNLPPDVKAQAKIKKWDSVQNEVDN